METKEVLRMRCEQTVESLLKKIDRVLDEADDSGYLSREDVCLIKDAWAAILHAKQACREQ